MTGVQILAAGSYVPDTVVRNEDLARLAGCDSDWIIQRTGIRERRKARDDQATSDLCYEASRRCLEHAGVPVRDVDLIIVATMTPDMATPSTSCNLQCRLGAVAPAMDINAACSGFMYALVTAMQFVKTGSNRCVLVVGADITSRIANPSDPKTLPLFGDGAGAVLVGPGDESQGLLAYTLGSEGDLGESLSLPGGGSREPLTPEKLLQGRQYVHMDGRAVFKWAVRLVNDTVHDVTRFADISIHDLDLIVLHQANLRIIDAAVDLLGIDHQRVLVNLDRYGNTTAGSIPLGLDEALENGRLRRGSQILISGFGAGLTWGAAVMRW